MIREVASDESWDEYDDGSAGCFDDLAEAELMALDDFYKIRSQRNDFLKKVKGKGKKFTRDYVNPQKLHPDLRQAELMERKFRKGFKSASYEQLKEQFGDFRNILYLESDYREQMKIVDVMFLWCYAGEWVPQHNIPEILRAALHIKDKWGERIAIGILNTSKYPNAIWIPESKYHYYHFSVLWNGKFKTEYKDEISASIIQKFVEVQYKEYQTQKQKDNAEKHAEDSSIPRDILALIDRINHFL